MIRGPLALFDIEPSQSEILRDCKVELRTSHGRSVISESQDSEDDNDIVEFSNQKTALPVKRRFSSPLIISFSSRHLGIKQKTIAEVVIWLLDVPDRTRKRIEVPGKSQAIHAGPLELIHSRLSQSIEPRTSPD